MEAMRESWTDARLDDFRTETARSSDALGLRMDDGFKRVDADIRALRGEMNERFAKVDDRFEAMQGRLEAIQRMMFRFCALAMTALIGTLATIVTQL
jgi:hypothetical protein